MKLVLTLIGLAVAVNCAIIKKGENCLVKAEDKDWWQTAVFYQIYPRSFKDSNNDGIGDIQGIIQKLDHFKDAGITAVWLSPIFKSPQVDQGYDISDYRQIEPDYGTLDDLRELLEKAHEMGLKIVLDFVPNHTSDEHEWFIKSVNKEEGYEDFYIWKDAKKDENGNNVPPNNWISLFKDSAWTWVEQRQQYYLHQFAPAQPDLNYENPKVVEEMKDILRYWLDFGVDGFRIDAIPFLFEDDLFRDEPRSDTTGVGENDYEYLDHIYTKDLNSTLDMVYQWRALVDEYTAKNSGETRVLMTEAYTDRETTMLYYGTPNGEVLGAHFTFNFNFISYLNQNSSAYDVVDQVTKWRDLIPDIYTSNWVLGNHDNPRVATRYGPANVDGFNLLIGLLPGVQVTYNGEEIGQENGEVTCEQGQDPSAIKNCSTFDRISRDFERTPFQWDNTVNAGFNEGAEPWLPVSKKANETNLASQKVENLTSHYNIYKSLLALRKDIGTGFENLEIVALSHNTIRLNNKIGDHQYSLLFNKSDDDLEIVEVVKSEVVLASVTSSRKIGDPVYAGYIALGPNESILLRLD